MFEKINDNLAIRAPDQRYDSKVAIAVRDQVYDSERWVIAQMTMEDLQELYKLMNSYFGKG